jgi:hypothetical protein
MPGFLSVATTASSANVTVIDSIEFDKSEVYSRYKSDPRTLPWLHEL